MESKRPLTCSQGQDAVPYPDLEAASPYPHTDRQSISSHLYPNSDSYNKQLLFSETELASWPLQRRRNVFSMRSELNV
jgi:hypothetical protein